MCQVCSQCQSHHCHKSGGHHSANVAVGQLPWAVLESQPLARAISPPGSHFRGRARRVVLPHGSQNCQNCRHHLRPVGVMKMSSPVGASRRLREFTLLCADGIDWHVRCFVPEWRCFHFGLSSHQRSRSRINVSSTLPCRRDLKLGCSVPSPSP